MAKKKLRIGIIGTGGIARWHAYQYLKMDDCKIVALADLVPGKAQKFAENLGIKGAKYYNSHKELLDDAEALGLDGVSICTYNRQHAEPTIYALDRGINVLLEKPFTVTLDEAVAVMRAEKRSGKILSIGFQPRFHASMQYMKEIVRSGRLGQVYYIQTGGGRRRGIPGSTFIEDKTAGIGALGDIGCYSLDMCLDAIGYPKPLTVSAFKTDIIGKDPAQYDEADRFSVDEFAVALIRLEGGVTMDFRISWALNVDTPGDTLIIGNKAGLRIPSTDCWNGGFGEMTLYETVDGKDIETKLPEPENKVDCFYGKVRSFLDAIKTPGAKSPVPSSQILYNQAIIDGIVRSANLGREVDIVIPEI
ncbi:MAG: Gfo/Idh/MocA family oxidoreductase [Clostridia bacterium]|nr:Gfo/Idh/MocA family oxidoreductase [Clostridia bacterium]